MNPILAVPAVVGGYLVLLGGIQLWSRLGKVDVETTRKSAHVGGALLTLPFPWIFPDLRLPLAISVGFMILLEFTRRKGWLRAVHGVERPSRGAMLFPVGLFLGLSFAMIHHDPWIHVASVLELGICDCLAALVGRRVGSVLPGRMPGEKSLEGSMAFLVSSLVVMATTLSFATALPFATVLVVAMGASLFLTWVEFVGRNGFDNLLIPIAVGLVFPLILHEELFGWAALGAGGVGMAGLLLSTSFRAMIHHFVVRLFLRSQIS